MSKLFPSSIQRRMRFRSSAGRVGIALAATGALVALAACGGSGESASGDKSDGSGGDKGKFSEKGPITLASGKDTSGYLNKEVKAWNKKYPKQKVTLRELPEDADQQRQQMVQNAETKSSTFTVLTVDVVWTAEFAAKQYIDPLPTDELDMDKFLPATVDSAKYFNKLYAVPYTSDGALFYYRKDLLKKAGISGPPKTWSEMKSDCAKIKKLPEGKNITCYGGQFQKYEGMVVNFAETVNGAGGSIVSKDGKKVTVDSPEAKKGLDFLADGFKSGMMSKGEFTWKEEESRRAFQQGKVAFLRNWPYVHEKFAAKDGSSKVNGKFDVSPIPGADGTGVSSLGGHNLGINKYGKNKGTALGFIKFMTSDKEEKKRLDNTSLAPTVKSIYSDKKLQKKYPYLPVLLKSIEHAKPRPKVVEYGDASKAIQDAVYPALQGKKSSKEALSEAQKNLKPLVKK